MHYNKKTMNISEELVSIIGEHTKTITSIIEAIRILRERIEKLEKSIKEAK